MSCGRKPGLARFLLYISVQKGPFWAGNSFNGSAWHFRKGGIAMNRTPKEINLFMELIPYLVVCATVVTAIAVS